ncbi:MAG: glycosyltransferase family 39 protein [Treponema sp.]|jgi:4-amino-4-deoxy-L-arabinose transferase-like glycosyltransferase|nr:glycosyltransferase family 39 protein [Treponema sp.]
MVPPKIEKILKYKKSIQIAALALCVFIVARSIADNYRSQYFAEGQRMFTGTFPFFMHSPYYKDTGQIDDSLTIKATLLFGMAKEGHIQFYVNKYKEAEGIADGVALVIYADEKEIARVKENPYFRSEPKHSVTFNFDIPAGTRVLTVKVEANENIAYDHTFIEALNVRKPSVSGWILFSMCIVIILFLLTGSEIKDAKEKYPEVKAQVKKTLSKDYWYGVVREPIFYVLLISIVARIVYLYDWIPFLMSHETYYYIKLPVINSYRVPFYPIFSRLVHFGDEFLWYRTMVNIQTLCGIISACYFYRIAERLIKNKRAAFFCAVFYSCLPYIVVYERSIMSESFAISFTIFLVYCVARYLQNPNKYSAIMIGVWSLMLVMLKEIYIVLLIPLFLLFWIIRLFLENDGALVKAGFKWMLICWGIVLFHAYLFNARIGIFANSIISTNYNVSYILIQHDLYHNPIDPEITNEISQKGKIESSFDVWPYIDSLHEKFGVTRMMRYWKDALKKNIGGFLKYSIDELWKTRDRSLFDNSFTFDGMRRYIKDNINNSYISIISQLPEEDWKKLDLRYKEKMNGEFFVPLFFPDIKLWHIWTLVFIEAIVILHSLIRRKRILYLEIIISGITVAVFLGAVIMTWGYDQRFSIPAIPLVVLLGFLNLSRLFDSKKML